MSVEVKVSRYFFGGWTTESITTKVSGGTVGQCLDNVVNQYPSLKTEILDNDGGVAAGARIFINGESAFPGELARQVKDGDVIDIIPMQISGG